MSSTVTKEKTIIDLNTKPLVPEGWSLKYHKQYGQFEWSREKTGLYLSKKQEDGGYTTGNELYTKLKDKLVANATLLDYLIDHPTLIPEEWGEHCIFFWGTIYIFDGSLCVRCLFKNNNGWSSCHARIHSVWPKNFPALVLKSNYQIFK